MRLGITPSLFSPVVGSPRLIPGWKLCFASLNPLWLVVLIHPILSACSAMLGAAGQLPELAEAHMVCPVGWAGRHDPVWP